MRTIQDEGALEAPLAANLSLDYIRSKTDPYALIAGRSGEVYLRRDGHRWEYPAYVVTLEKDGVTVTREHRFAYCDSQVYAPAVTQSAA